MMHARPVLQSHHELRAGAMDDGMMAGGRDEDETGGDDVAVARLANGELRQ